MTRTTSSRTLVPLACACLATTLALAVSQPVRADQPVTVHVDKPLYPPTAAGLTDFLEDELGRLVVGQEWAWGGSRFRVVRMHRIVESAPTRAEQANRDYDAPVRGWAVAVVHVMVDGRLLRGRIKVNASYAWQPAGWQWEQVLLSLGGADSWDFVSRKVV
jgi:hypothetical protein